MPGAVPSASGNTLRKVAVVGSTGSGKTTMARALAARLGVPQVELDELHWEASWVEAPAEVFRERVTAALDGSAWVVDGNYSIVRDIVWSQAGILHLKSPRAARRWLDGVSAFSEGSESWDM